MNQETKRFTACAKCLCIILLFVSPICGRTQQISETPLRDGVVLYEKKGSVSIWQYIKDKWGWVVKSRPFGKSIAFIVGIGKYKHISPNLLYVHNDLKEMRDFLLNQAGFDMVYVAQDDIATADLVDDYMFNKLPQVLSDDDRLLFYFSGHGADLSNTGYMLFSQAHEYYERGQYLEVTRTETWSRQLPAKHVVFLIDACNSGLGYDAKQGDSSAIDQELLAQFSGDGSRDVVTAGTGSEKAFQVIEGNEKGYSVFTRAFLDSIRYADSASGFLTLDEIVANLKRRVADFSRGKAGRQMTPRQWHIPRQPGRDKGTFIFINPRVMKPSIPASIRNYVTVLPKEGEERTADATAVENAQILAELKASRAAESLLAEDPAAINESTLLLADAMRHNASLRTDAELRANMVLLRKPLQTIAIQAQIRSVATSDNGRWVAVATEHGTILLLSTKTWQPVKTWQYEGAIVALAFNHGGDYFASCGDDHTIHVVSTYSLEQVNKVAYSGNIRSLVFSPDGTRLAASSDAGLVTIIDVPTGGHVVTLSSQNPLIGAYFSPDGNQLVTGSVEGRIGIYASHSNVPLNVKLLQAPIRILRVSPDGGWIAAAATNGHVALLNTKMNFLITDLQHKSGIRTIVFSNDSKLLAIGTADGYLHVYSVPASCSRELFTIKTLGFINDVVFSQDNRWVAVASGDKTARIIESASGNEIARIPHASPVMAVNFTSDNALLISGSTDGQLKVSEVEGGTEKPRLIRSGAYGVALGEHGKLAAFATQSQDLILVDVKTQSEQYRLASNRRILLASLNESGSILVTADDGFIVRAFGMSNKSPLFSIASQNWVRSVVISNGAKFVAVGDDAGIIRIRDLRHAEREKTVKYSGPVDAMCFSQNDRLLAVAGADQEIHIYDLVDGAEMQLEPMGLGRHVTVMSFSFAGGFLVVGRASGDVEIYDTKSRTLRRRITYNDAVTALAASEDGDLLALATSGVIHVIRAETGEEVKRIISREREIKALALNEHEDALLVMAFDTSGGLASADVSVREITLATDTMIKQSCLEAGGYLTEAVWHKYLPSEPFHDICMPFQK